MKNLGRTGLYRLYDADRHLLYVGIATVPTVRWSQHAGLSPWWEAVDAKEVEWFPTRQEAEAAEVEAIAVERPVWNKSPGVRSAEREASRGSLAEALRPALRRYSRAEKAFIAAQTALESELVREFKEGVSAEALAGYAPWNSATILALAKRAGVQRMRKPTVGKGTAYPGIRQAQRARDANA